MQQELSIPTRNVYNILLRYLQPNFNPESEMLNVLHLGLTDSREDIAAAKFLRLHNKHPFQVSLMSKNPDVPHDIYAHKLLTGTAGNPMFMLNYVLLGERTGRPDYDLILVNNILEKEKDVIGGIFELAASQLSDKGVMFSTSKSLEERFGKRKEETFEQVIHSTKLHKNILQDTHGNDNYAATGLSIALITKY